MELYQNYNKKGNLSPWTSYEWDADKVAKFFEEKVVLGLTTNQVEIQNLIFHDTQKVCQNIIFH